MATTATRRTRKSTVKKNTTTVKPAATRTRTPKREQDSVTITMQRGKRDRTTREIKPHEPQSGGGVRFEEISDNGSSPVYLSQEQDAALGKPQKIRVTVKAL
jgi:hypothetical protein